MPAQSTLNAKMQQLSLNDHQNQMFTVTATGNAFGPPGNSYANQILASYLQDSPGI
jgi:replication factor A1